MNPVPRLKTYRGPALLSYGFRPFFFLGATYAAVAVAIWVAFFRDEIALPIVFAPRDWHVHEMLFGYLSAAITGFLLTAIPNWTGRLPLQGASLLLLVGVWFAGRIAMAFSAHLGWFAAAAIDCAFLVLVAGVAGREIFAGSNWRNFKILLPVTALSLANIGFHIEAHVAGIAVFATRIGIAAILMLIMLIGGRIIPSFTHNWLVRSNPGRLPVPFGKFDALAITVSAAALVLWIVLLEGWAVGAALFGAGILQLLRLARWAGDRTAADPLVVVLHVGYAFVPLGFVLMALAAVGAVQPSAGLHAWMVGAAGILTLAVMTRATLGHTGSQLVANTATQAIYAAVILAALTRIAAALMPAWTTALIHVSAFAWIAAFGGFAVFYAPLLFGHRRH
ncbi:MAG TPA: NnrS family protein [Xanthobacteraceae bacterium]|nr:NnrS family protein [Xanthobacteraceae bacterium]